MIKVNNICPELLKIIGLLPFLFILIVENINREQKPTNTLLSLSIGNNSNIRSVISIIIIVNGFICHYWYHTEYWKIDVATNAILITFINYTTTWQPFTIIITIIAIFSWFIKPVHLMINACIHIFMVQFLLAIPLYNYCFYDIQKNIETH